MLKRRKESRGLRSASIVHKSTQLTTASSTANPLPPLRSSSSSMVSYAYTPPGYSAATSSTMSAFLRTIILCLIAGAAMASREFAVVRFESIIHE